MSKLKKGLKFLARYGTNLLLSFDQTVNAIMMGDPDETISSRLGRAFPGSIVAKAVDKIFFWQNNHTLEAWKAELSEKPADDDLIKPYKG